MAASAPLEMPPHNITVVGSFNPQIIRPDWVRRHILSPAERVETLLPDGVGPIVYRCGGLTWFATKERLVAYSAKPQESGKFIYAILRKLPQTPLTAAGVNFKYPFTRSHADPDRIGPWRLDFDERHASALLGGTLKEGRLVQTVVREGRVQLGLTVVWQPGMVDVELQLNFHLEAQGQDEIERATQLAEHAMRAPTFAEEAGRILEGLRHDDRYQQRQSH